MILKAALILRCRMFTCTCIGVSTLYRIFALTCIHPCRHVNIQNVDLLFGMFLMVRCRLCTQHPYLMSFFTYTFLHTELMHHAVQISFALKLRLHATLLIYRIFACTCIYIFSHTQSIERTRRTKRTRRTWSTRRTQRTQHTRRFP